MIYNGPSTGCENCRKRHTTCDEKRPACIRCTFRGLTCPGYRDFDGTVFRDVSRRVFRKQSRRAKESSALTNPQMPADLRIDTQTACINFFFRNYIQTSLRDTSTSRGHFDHLVPLYNVAAPSSPLVLATTVMAARAICLYYNQSQNTLWHARSDVAATQAIKAAIMDAVECLRDETLLAVLCLDFAENLSSRTAGNAPSRAHRDGALALVQHRGPSNFSSSVSRSLLAATRSNTLLQALWYGDERSQDAVALLPDVELGDCNPAVALHYILVGVLKLERLMLKTTQAIVNDDSHQHTLSRVSLARSLDGQLLDWYDSTPSEWKLVVCRPLLVGPWPMQSMVEGFPTLQAAYIFGQWHCARLMALKFLYAAITEDCNDVQDTAATLQKISADAEMVVDGLCSVLSYIKNGCGPYAVGTTSVERKMEQLTGMTNQESAYRNGTSSGCSYLLNLLTWVLAVFTEKLQGAQGYTVRSGIMTYLQTEYRVVLGVLKEQTQHQTSSPYSQIAQIGVHVTGGFQNAGSTIGPFGNRVGDYILAMDVKAGYKAKLVSIIPLVSRNVPAPGFEMISVEPTQANPRNRGHRDSPSFVGMSSPEDIDTLKETDNAHDLLIGRKLVKKHDGSLASGILTQLSEKLILGGTESGTELPPVDYDKAAKNAKEQDDVQTLFFVKFPVELQGQALRDQQDLLSSVQLWQAWSSTICEGAVQKQVDAKVLPADSKG